MKHYKLISPDNILEFDTEDNEVVEITVLGKLQNQKRTEIKKRSP